MTEMFAEFPLEIAHSLPRMPDGHKCRRVHGHSYKVRVSIGGADPDVHGAGSSGMLMDYASLDGIWAERIHARLDHQNLNEVLTSDLTTSEVLARWIGETVSHYLPPGVHLKKVELWETARFGARWTP